MQIVLEKLRDRKGRLVDVLPCPAGKFMKAEKSTKKAYWVQTLGGIAVQSFAEDDLIVIEL